MTMQDSRPAPHGLTAYRPDIDGLRAIAVLAVLLFHADHHWLPGGYLGVDVFFVISGYLITSIALTERQRDAFSWRGFYLRRARRLMPALLAVLLVTTVVAAVVMHAQERAAYGRSLLATLGWVSNLYFWRTSAYFGEAANNTALLHTWSLAVEEQFYLAFPLLLALIGRTTATTARWRVAGLFGLSLALGVWAAHKHPNAAFYLLPFRAWELMAGAMLAVLHQRGTPSSAPLERAQRWLGLPALGGLLLAVALYRSDSTAIPAVLPNLTAVLCTTALIHAGRNGRGAQHRLLACRPLVFIGLVSYSLYLWHQPALSLARLVFGTDLPASLRVIALLLSFGLAALTWRFVERPWRRMDSGNTRAVLGTCLALGLALGVVGAWLHHNLGLSRAPAPWQRTLLGLDFDTGESQGVGTCFLRDHQPPDAFGPCRVAGTGTGTALLWGDSHAAHLMPGFEIQRGWFGELTQRAFSGCPGLLPAATDAPRCAAARRFVLDEIRRAPPEHVLLAGRWTRPDVARLAPTVQALREAGVARVTVLGPLPRWRGGLPGWLLEEATHRQPIHEGAPQLATELPLPHAAQQAWLNDRMREALRHSGAQYIDALAMLCTEWPRCIASLDGSVAGVVVWDPDHLTRAGSEFVAARLATQLSLPPAH